MRPLFFLLLFYPLLELWLLIKVGSLIGALPVLALIALSGLGGLAIMRRAGWFAMWRARTSGAPVAALTDGFLVAGAGLLLFLPGLLGDLLGVLLLIPATRRRLARRLWEPLMRRQGMRPQAEVIEGEFHRHDEPGASVRPPLPQDRDRF